MTISSLDFDLIAYIYKYLDLESSKALSQTARKFRIVFSSENLKKLLIKLHFPFYFPGINTPYSELYQRLYAAYSAKPRAICPKTLSGHTLAVNCQQFSPDKKTALSGSSDNTLKLWDLTNGNCLMTLVGHTGRISCLHFRLDGKTALSGSWDCTLRLWDLTTGESLQTFTGHTNLIECLQISSDGTRALSGSSDNTLKLWDLTNGNCLRTFNGHTSGISYLQFGPDETRALSGSYDGSLKLWDLTNGNCLRTFTGHASGISCLQFNPTGTRALSGSYDGTLKLWDLTNDNCLMTIAAHATMIECLQFNSDGTKALSRSNDGTLKFWDLSNGGCLHTLDRQILDINCLQFNPDGTQMLAGSIDGTLKLWDFGALPEERLSSLARDCISTPDKVNEAFSFLTPHAQNGVCYQLFKNQKASTSLPPHEYGRLSFLREQGFHASDQERAQAVNHYNATQVALPEIRTVLRKAILQSTSPNASLLSASAIRRITALPDPIRYVVYAKLEEIHRREKKIPQPCPSNYGELTFANNATDQERITAIIEAIELLNVSYSEPRRT